MSESGYLAGESVLKLNNKIEMLTKELVDARHKLEVAETALDKILNGRHTDKRGSVRSIEGKVAEEIADKALSEIRGGER